MKQKLFERILDLAGLNEDLNTMWERGFSSIPKEDFFSIIRMDPTSTEDKPGKFFKELITLYKNGKFSTNNKLGYQEIINYALEDQILAKNISWLFNLHSNGSLKAEDLYKASEYISKYQDFKSEIGTPLQSFSSLPELYIAVSPYMDKEKELSTSEKAAAKKEAKKVYEDDNWHIIVPESHAAACVYGAGTQWCTASRENDSYYRDYTSKGPLYILINKKNKDSEGRQEKYQFHFQTNQYMDVNDNDVDQEEMFDYLSEGVKKFFINANYEDFSGYDKENESLTLTGDVTDLQEAFNRDQSDFVEKVLKGEFYHYSDLDSRPLGDILQYTDLSSSNKKKLEEIASKINKDWEEEFDDIEEFITDSEDTEVEGMIDAITNADRFARESAAESEVYKAIIESVKDGVGAENLEFTGDGKIKIEIPVSEGTVGRRSFFFYPARDLYNFFADRERSGEEPIKFDEPYYGFGADGPDEEEFNEILSDQINEIPEPEPTKEEKDQLKFDGLESARLLDLAGILKE